MKKYWVSTSSGRIELQLTDEQARRVSGMGDMYTDTAAMVRRELMPQLKRIRPSLLRDELREYGAWEPADLFDHHENLIKLVWVMACDLADRFHVYNPVTRGRCIECGLNKAEGYHVTR